MGRPTSRRRREKVVKGCEGKSVAVRRFPTKGKEHIVYISLDIYMTLRSNWCHTEFISIN